MRIHPASTSPHGLFLAQFNRKDEESSVRLAWGSGHWMVSSKELEYQRLRKKRAQKNRKLFDNKTSAVFQMNIEEFKLRIKWFAGWIFLEPVDDTLLARVQIIELSVFLWKVSPVTADEAFTDIPFLALWFYRNKQLTRALRKIEIGRYSLLCSGSEGLGTI